MPPKRRRSSADDYASLYVSKRARTRDPLDFLSGLSDELLIRILHNLPIEALLLCQQLSHRFSILTEDSQIWKNLYYNRFVLPRALRIPGIKAAQPETSLHFSSRRSKWLDDNTLVNRVDGKKTNWKKQYKLRHNWSIGACEVQEIHVADRPSIPSMLIKLAEGLVITADTGDGLRAWDLKGKVLISKCDFEEGLVPTCLAVDEQESGNVSVGIAVGFKNGGWGTWKLDTEHRTFSQIYRHPASSIGRLSAIAFANPYVLSITSSQLLSLYTFAPTAHSPPLSCGDSQHIQTTLFEDLANDIFSTAPDPVNAEGTGPRLLASLKSHTSWPPLSLSIRTTSSAIIASIAYSLPTYFSGYTIGLQELHLSLKGDITFSRLTSALPQGFSSILTSPPSSGTVTPLPTQTELQASSNPSAGSTHPTSLSYSHPYILATHPDNTLTLYLCTSTASTLTITPGTKLWGHTSSVSSAEITPRGKAVSVSTRGNELRVWELEGGLSTSTSTPSSRKKTMRFSDRSVMIRADDKGDDSIDFGKYEEEAEASKRWVGFDDEMVIVLKESGKGSQALMVYDFT